MDRTVEEGGKRIPVFTVLKNGAHVKNIILSRPCVSEAERGQEDVIMMVGRHPDCDIVLEHPSISRYHLQLKISEFSEKLLVTDVSSVHGTIVSGRKMTPHVPVQVEEGDILRLGASTRIYKLKWVSSIFDLDNEDDVPSISQKQENMRNGVLLDGGKQKHWPPSAPPLMPEFLCPSLPGSPIRSTTSKKENQGRQSGETKENTGTGNLWHRRCISSNAPRLRKNTKGDEWLGMVSYTDITNPERKGAVGPNDNEVGVRENAAALDVSSEAIEPGAEKVLPHDSCTSSCSEDENTLLSNKECDKELDRALCVEIANLEMGAPISIHQKNNEAITDIVENQEGVSDLKKENFGTNEFVASNHIESYENTTIENVYPETKGWHVVQGISYDSISSCSEDEVVILPNKKIFTPQTFQCVSELNVVDGKPNGLQPVKSIIWNCYAPANPDQGGGVMSEELHGSGYRSVREEKKYFSSDLLNLIPTSNCEVTDRYLAESNNEIAVTAEQSSKRHLFQPSPLGRPPLGAGTTKSSREDTFPSDKENSTHQVPACVLRSSRRLEYGDLDDDKSSGTLFTVEEPEKCSRLLGSSPSVRGCLDMEDGFISDKENMTPQTPSASILKSRVKLTSESSRTKANKRSYLATTKQETKFEGLCGSPSSALSDSIADDMFPSDKENITPKFARVLKSNTKAPSKFKEEMILKIRQEERVPFQNLLIDSPGDIKLSSSIDNASGNDNIVTSKKVSNEGSSCSASFRHQAADTLGAAAKKKWYMVVDTSCLLNAQSRRSLKLMEGLNGTQLIIPRMVVRELDSLKHKASRFRKESEASLVMQWVEHCMVKMSWWTHVQSSGECFPVSATPPVSPLPQPSQGGRESSGCNATSSFTDNQTSFSSYGSFAEIVSPTVEDHILECALLFKKLKTDGQLVLLTKEVGLRIKAMAEGLICDTPEEFCQSLVNPYSERFLWLESTPRGPTWSNLDDLRGLRGSHHEPARISLKKVLTEGAKGLKLVLRHK